MRVQFNGGVMTLDKCISILDKIVECSLYGLAFSIPISIALVETFTTTAIVAFLLKKILSMKPGASTGPWQVSFFTPSNIFLLIFFVCCGLSLANSGPYLSKGLNALFGKWGKFMLLYWVASASLGKEKHLKNIILAFFASAVLVAFDAYSQKFLGFEFFLHRSMTEVNYAGRLDFAVTGAFKHSNMFAAYLILAIPLLAASMAGALRKTDVVPQPLTQTLSRSSLLAVVLLLTFFLVLTFARGAWLGFIVAAILMFFLLPPKKFFFFLGTVFILLIVLLPGVSERVATSVQAGGDSGRYELWKGAWAMIAEHPFLGKGVGTFMAFFQDYVQGRGVMYAHNCFLQIWAETGIFSLLSFLAFLGAVLRNGFMTLRRNKCGEMTPLVAGLLCGVIAFLIQSALNTNLYSLQPSAMFWLFLGMIQALSCSKGRKIRSGLCAGT